MSDEDKEQKTELPTQKRIDDFRKQGRIAFSRDLVGAATFMAALALLGIFGRLMTGIIVSDTRERLAGAGMQQDLVWPWRPLAVMAIFVTVVAVIAALASLAQMGFPAEPDFFRGLKNYNPLGKLKQLFGMSGIENLGAQIVKATMLGCILYIVLKQEWVVLATSAQIPLMDSLAFASRFAWKLGVAAVGTLLAIGAFDYWRLHRDIMSDMKMTKEEIKREAKEDSGDPQVKGRMRRMVRNLLKNDINKAIASADVIVTNPTHFAVALKYDSKKMRAPKVVAKGVDHTALKIREIAGKKRVPIIENRPLARALHAQVKVGKDVPVELYKAVAEVLAAVYRARKARL
jgi:flagellar biosynthesis protein FlhB